MTIRIAIVGAGPSGLYTAQSLVRAVKDAEIDILDQLPVPYGLIRYGIAPDHQGTKTVVRQFERLFERDGCRFFGNIRIGRDISLEALSSAYDVVVVAAGLAGGRKLDVPGEGLSGVYDSGSVTRWLNSHPEAGDAPHFGSHPVIVGNGNVALDVARILAKLPDEFEHSDLDPDRAAAIESENVEVVEVVGRSPAAVAKFDPALLKELVHLKGVRIEVEGDLASEEGAERPHVLDAFAEIAGHAPEGAKRVLRFRFGMKPVSIEGSEKVSAIRFEGGNGELLQLPATSVITAIGFQSSADCLLGRSSLCDTAGEGAHAGGNIFLAGWFRTGPRGTVAEARREAKITSEAVVAWLGKGNAEGGKGGLAPLVATLGLDPVSYEDWLRVRAAEESEPPAGRVRRKVASVGAMLDIIKGSERQAS